MRLPSLYPNPGYQGEFLDFVSTLRRAPIDIECIILSLCNSVVWSVDVERAHILLLRVSAL